MKSKPNHPKRAPLPPVAARGRARSRFAQASVCGLLGVFLWALPTAQAETPFGPNSAVGSVDAPATRPLPDQPKPSTVPITLAANGAPMRLTIGMATGAAAAAAAATRAPSGRGPDCTGRFGEQKSVVVPLGKSTMVDLSEPVRARTVGNPQIVNAMLVSPTELYLVGAEIGTTNMIVQGRSGSCSVIDVSVGVDAGGLQQTLAALMPEETGVRVVSASDSLVLTGTVSDATKAQRIVDLANAFVDRQQAQASANAPSQESSQGGSGSMLTLSLSSPGSGSGNNNGGGNEQRIKVINMLHVAAPQQVMLEVKVAEVDKTLINQLGAAANLNGTSGSWSFGLLADYLSGGLSALSAAKSNTLPLNLTIDAQKTDQLTKILAEPNLMAISGQEASFLAGGKVFIPVPQSNGVGGSTIVLQEEEFGVGLTFTPTVLAGGRINLKVAPEVSELSPTGVTVTATGTNSTAILPLITTRRASTTVQLNDGQSFAIGGLLKNNVTGALKALPGIGELPVIGALARDTNYESDKTELIFVVTPHLVKPLPQDYPLPTDHFGDVNEAEVYATGNMEGHPRAPAAAPASVPAPASAPAAAAPATDPSAAATPAPVAAPAVVTSPLPAAGAAPAPVTPTPVTSAPAAPAPTTPAVAATAPATPAAAAPAPSPAAAPAPSAAAPVSPVAAATVPATVPAAAPTPAHERTPEPAAHAPPLTSAAPAAASVTMAAADGVPIASTPPPSTPTDPDARTVTR
jgi:pilus assembly protein CpaC